MKKFFANIAYNYKHNNYPGWIVPLTMCLLGLGSLFVAIIWAFDAW